MRHVEALSDEEIKSDTTELLNRFLAKDYPEMTPPEEILVTRWHSNPLTRGSYSYQTVESVRLNAVDKMTEPAMGGKLLFGGEATSCCIPAPCMEPLRLAGGRREESLRGTILITCCASR